MDIIIHRYLNRMSANHCICLWQIPSSLFGFLIVALDYKQLEHLSVLTVAQCVCSMPSLAGSITDSSAKQHMRNYRIYSTVADVTCLDSTAVRIGFHGFFFFWGRERKRESFLPYNVQPSSRSRNALTPEVTQSITFTNANSHLATPRVWFEGIISASFLLA